MSGTVIVRMWEARAEKGRLPDLVEWVCDTALPRIEVNPLHITSEVFSSSDDRCVVISRWRSDPERLAAPPPLLVARPPHEWDFTLVDR
ncbi:hypothetical protein Ais01nite_38850 [Asanoa ishikariensis]|uniref:Antibiotic biosynthesis monooxygenase n=1 Tax=Asanoa ishikariensis TaxID=137265 RepID=A0A1H3M2R4_9ACTN|nr:hypothetical protein Ais01nite_38850 [Asanoa ishikariensis]SDY70558.1 hypothetical protein SAMN05421684_1126 [Asanoa ishikariensis]